MKETGETAEAISQSMVREVESQEPKRAMAKKKLMRQNTQETDTQSARGNRSIKLHRKRGGCDN